MLSNAIVASMLATSYVLIVVLQLNPTLPLHPVRLAPLAWAIGPFYLVYLTVITYAMLVFGQLFSRELFSPGWLSVRTLSWLGALAAGAGAALMWANVDTFALVLEPATARAMTSGGVAVAAASALFSIVALSRPRVRSGPRVTAAICLSIVAAGSVVTPMMLRGRGIVEPLAAHVIDAALDVPDRERQARVVLIAIDGGSLDLVTHATAEGRLPNFGRILDAGAVMHLATLHPTSAQAVWAAVATGKLPQKNGVRSANVYRLSGSEEPVRLLPDFCFASGLVRFGFLTDEPHTAATLRARTLWSLLSAEGIPVGVVNWPLTDPAPSVRGYVVSDTYAEWALSALAARGARRCSRRPTSAGARCSIRRSSKPRPCRSSVPRCRIQPTWSRQDSKPSWGRGINSQGASTARTTASAEPCSRVDRRRSVWCGTRAWIRWATTSCGTRCRSVLAISATASGDGSRPSSSATTRSSTKRSAAPWRRSGRRICCSWCRATEWSRSDLANDSSSRRSAIPR